jgi:hypothetical protein
MGSPFIGISMTTLKSLGTSRPEFTRSRFMGVFSSHQKGSTLLPIGACTVMCMSGKRLQPEKAIIIT